MGHHGGTMPVNHFQKTWGFLPVFIFLILFFTSCTQGQQGPGSREGVSTEGTETIRGGTEALPGAGSCDTPENANNVLCQWVATELVGKQGDTPIRKVLIAYYDTGWPKEVTDIDQNGNKKSIHQIYYDNNLVLEKTVAQESPDPGTDNFTRVVTKIIKYNPNGSIDKVTTEKKDNTGTQLFRTTEASYSYPSNSQMDVATNIMDDPGVVTSKSHSTTLKDPSSGKINSIETKVESSNGSGGFILETWYLDSYTYDPNGRIDKLAKSKQECSSSLISGGCQSSIQATELKTYDYDYDGQGRVSQFTASSDGDSYNPSIGVPDNQIETSLAFAMNYDPALPGKIARQHPLEILLTVDPESPFGQGFNDRDLFSSFSGQMAGAGIPANYPSLTMTVKWSRLWEVLPGGRPPGS